MKDISYVSQVESRAFPSRMLRFLENHDEERIASAGFAGNPWYAVPGMVVSATLSGGPVMVYFGQESGEPGRGKEGFGGEDNRTTIFDYWGVPEHQKWVNGGAFDGGRLSADQRKLRVFYSSLLTFCATDEAVAKGKFLELSGGKDLNKRMYVYLRYTAKERVLVVANFDRMEALKTRIVLPDTILSGIKRTGDSPLGVKEILSGRAFSVEDAKTGIPVDVSASGAAIYKF